MTFNDCHRLIKKGDTVALRRALDSGEIHPNLRNRFLWSLLMLATLEGDTSITELLLERGAAVNATNQFGETALSLAAHKGHLPCLKLLVRWGASSDVRPHGSNTLREWLEVASGLPPTKIAAIMQAIETSGRHGQSL